MGDPLWDTIGKMLTGGTLVAIVVAVFRFISSGRKQDAAEFVRLTTRVEVLESKHDQCLEKNAELQARITEVNAELVILRATLARLESTSITAIVTADSSGTIREWNPAATSLFGWSVDEAVGRPITMLVPARLRERQENSFAQAVKENRGPSAEAAAKVRESYALTRTGDEIPVTITLLGWEFQGKRFYCAEIRRR